MLKKLMLTSLVASTLSLGLTACGGGDGGDGGADSNTIDYTLNLSNIRKRGDNIYRVDDVINTGRATTTRTPIIGTEVDETDNDQDSLIFAPNFFAESDYDTFIKNITVGDNQWHTDIIGNDDKKITWGLEYSDKDISGVTAQSKKYYTRLNGLSNRFPVNTVFPVGSVCKVITASTVTTPYYELDLDHSEENYTLQEWKDKNTDEDVKTIQVGANNEYTLAYYNNEKYASHRAIIEYKGKVYDVEYQESENSFGLNEEGEMECWGYNDIAADYLVEQLEKKANAQ